MRSTQANHDEEAANYFMLRLESLRVIGGWAADCAERALAVYEL